MNIERQILGKRLRTLRGSLNLTRSKMEKLHGISARTIEYWEKGESDISVLKLVNYIKIFEEYGIKLSLDALLNFEEEVQLIRELSLD